MLLEAAGNAQDAGLLAEAEDLCRQLLELESTRSEAPLKASALNLLSKVMDSMGRNPEALILAEEALEVSERDGDPTAVVRELSNLTGALLFAHQPTRAKPLALRVVSMLTELGMSRELGSALGTLANCFQQLERFDESLETYHAAIASLRAAGNKRSEGITHSNLGALLVSKGALAEAAQSLEQALKLHRETGNRRSEGVALGNYGNVLFDERQYEKSLATYQQALAIHREVGNRRSEGLVLGSLGNTLLQLGRLDEAENCIVTALAIHRDLRNRRSEGVALGDLAEVRSRRGDPQRAALLLREALLCDVEAQNRRHEGLHLCALGLLELNLLGRATANNTWQRGIALLRAATGGTDYPNRVEAMRATCHLAGVAPFELPSELAAPDGKP